MANFVLNYSFSRALSIPIDEDSVKSTLSEVIEYVETKSKCYAGQLFSVTGDTEVNNGLYIALSTGSEGSVLKLATQEALDAVAASAGKIDKIQLNGTELTINDKVVNIDLSDYATVKSVQEQAKTTLALAITYTDSAITASEDKMMWLPVENGDEKHVVRHWRGTREKYEFLVKNNAVSDWTRYVVIDTIAGKDVITEYYGTNQVAELTGQLLPANSIITNILDITPKPYDRYLVGSNGNGYSVYEYVIDSEGSHRWLVKPFDDRFGIRVKDQGLMNFVYVDGELITYDKMDCGTF
jgi:hypothetical protein